MKKNTHMCICGITYSYKVNFEELNACCIKNSRKQQENKIRRLPRYDMNEILYRVMAGY